MADLQALRQLGGCTTSGKELFQGGHVFNDSLTAIDVQGPLAPFVGRLTDNQEMEGKLVDTVAARLKSARINRGMTLEAVVAEYCGLAGHAAVANWENQRNYPDLDHLVRVAELYGVSIDWICWGGEMGGLDAKIRKVPEVLRSTLLDRLNKEIDETMKAAQRLPKAMLGDHVADADSRLKQWSAKNKAKGPVRTPSKKKRHAN